MSLAEILGVDVFFGMLEALFHRRADGRRPIRVGDRAMEPLLRRGTRVKPRGFATGEPRVGQVVAARIDDDVIVRRIEAIGERIVLAADRDPARYPPLAVERAAVLGVIPVQR